MTEGAVSEAGQ